MQVAKALAEARRGSGLTLRALAARAKTSHSALASYESASKQPSTRTLVRVIDAAGYAVDFVLAPRCRGEAHQLPRGEELRQALELAEQFPAQHDPELTFPSFAAGGRRS